MVVFAGGHGADCVLIVSPFSLREAVEPTGGLRLRVGEGGGMGGVRGKVEVR